MDIIASSVASDNLDLELEAELEALAQEIITQF